MMLPELLERYDVVFVYDRPAPPLTTDAPAHKWVSSQHSTCRSGDCTDLSDLTDADFNSIDGVDPLDVRRMLKYDAGAGLTDSSPPNVPQTMCPHFRCLTDHKAPQICGNLSQPTFYFGKDEPYVACCSHLRRDLLIAVQRIITGLPTLDGGPSPLDGDFLILFGTLLGAIRDGGLIGWTKDIDIGISRSIAQRLLEPRIRIHVLREFGITLFRDRHMLRACFGPTYRNGRLRRGPTSEGYGRQFFTKVPYGDLYVFDAPPDALDLGSSSTIFAEHGCPVPTDLVFPMAEISLPNVYGLSEIEWPTPRIPEDVLRRVYGPGWLLPDRGAFQGHVCAPIVMYRSTWNILRLLGGGALLWGFFYLRKL